MLSFHVYLKCSSRHDSENNVVLSLHGVALRHLSEAINPCPVIVLTLKGQVSLSRVKLKGAGLSKIHCLISEISSQWNIKNSLNDSGFDSKIHHEKKNTGFSEVSSSKSCFTKIPVDHNVNVGFFTLMFLVERLCNTKKDENVWISNIWDSLKSEKP